MLFSLEFQRPISTLDPGRRSSVVEGPLYVPLPHTRAGLCAECGDRPVFPPETARPRLRARDRTPETARPRPHARDRTPAGPAPAPGCVAGWARKTCVWIGIVLGRMPFRARGGLISRMGPVALMPGAAFAVHQLSYWLAFGNRAAVVLQAQGHSYLHSVVPWIVVLIALSAGIFLQAGARSPATARCRATRSRSARCGSCAQPAWWRSTCRRSSSRACSRPAIRPASSGCSDTAAGGRCRRPWRSGSCSPRSSMVPAGCCETFLAGSRVARGRGPAGPRSVYRVTSFSRDRRPWRAVGRVGARRHGPEARSRFARSRAALSACRTSGVSRRPSRTARVCGRVHPFCRRRKSLDSGHRAFPT
jgi:hypothetical protein